MSVTLQQLLAPEVIQPIVKRLPERRAKVFDDKKMGKMLSAAKYGYYFPQPDECVRPDHVVTGRPHKTHWLS